MAKRPRTKQRSGKRKPSQASGARRSRSRKRTSSARKRSGKTASRRWSGKVTQESNALDLEEGVFTLKSPKKIAASLKRSAERSRRRKADAFRSALSMLTFYINRAGTNLPARRKRTLMEAKDELRRQFGRPVTQKSGTRPKGGQ
jgi:hypothetical protein